MADMSASGSYGFTIYASTPSLTISLLPLAVVFHIINLKSSIKVYWSNGLVLSFLKIENPIKKRINNRMNFLNFLISAFRRKHALRLVNLSDRRSLH